MRPTHWLIGCSLCIAGIGGAAAASVDTQGLDSASHGVFDNANTADSNLGSGGDALGLGRDAPAPGSNDGSGRNPPSASDRPAGDPSAPAPTRRPHLGWQSLLPGSIQ